MPSKLPQGGSSLLLFAFVAIGCGPSPQVRHEGTVRFEHCYRLDLDPRIAPSHRKACWQTWHERYSYGQPRDRIEYAQRRIQAIERNEPPPELQVDAPSSQSQFVEPDGPVDAHAPPPRMARPAKRGPATSEKTKEGSPEVPEDACTRNCRQAHGSCSPTCPSDEALPCPCDTAYRECMVGCFE